MTCLGDRQMKKNQGADFRSFRLHCWDTIAARREDWDGWQLRLKAPGKISGRKKEFLSGQNFNFQN
jgi:hypothetical protein